MHPAMAVWIWSMAMARAWQTSLWETARDSANGPEARVSTRSAADPQLVRANDYLRFEIAEIPLPDTLLDRLSELYWTERDSEMAI